MAKSLVFLLCSLFTLSFPIVSALAARHERGALPLEAKFAKQRRQVSDGSSPSTADSAAASSAASTDTQMFTALGNAAPTTSSMPTVTTTVTTTMAATTYTTTITTTFTMTTTTSKPPTTKTSTCPPTATASSCASLSTELSGTPYTAPLCTQFTLECNSYYYTDDSNILATYYNIATFRDCADLCDDTDGCNLFFLGTQAAGDQAQECFLLTSDEYGQATDSTIADAGVRVGYVSQQGAGG